MFFSLTMLGCAQVIGNTRFPEPSANFTPKKVYTVPQDRAWNAIDTVLEENRIPLASSDKAAGRIVTDYVQGQSQVNAMGFLGGNSTRYKYNIRLTTESPDRTRVNVAATLESSGNELQSWRNISNDNPQVIAALENWLYEQIEKQFQ